MTATMTPAPSPDPESPYTPKWMPSQFKGVKRAAVRRSREFEDASLGETIANSVSGGIGAALAIAGLVILVVMAVLHGGGIRLFAALVFGVPLLLAFLMSTLYHALPSDTAKLVFRVLGHDFVFLLIAGAFTPYCLLTLAGDQTAQAVLGVEWVLAFAGILVESIWLNHPRWLNFALSIAMCAIGLTLAPALLAALPAAGWGLLVAAFACFAVGLVFYLFRKVPYLLFVSHLILLGGSICLFLSVVLFVI